MKHRCWTALFLAVFLAGCSSAQKTTYLDDVEDIYSGNLTAEMLGVSEAQTYSDAISKGEAAQRQGELDRAAAFFVRAIELASAELEKEEENSVAVEEVSQAGVRLARLYQSRGMQEQAERVYLMILDLDDSEVTSLEALGLIRLRERRSKDAADYLLRAVNSWHDKQTESGAVKISAPVKAFNGLAIIADLSEDYEIASGYYRNALQLVPNDYTIMNNLGYSLYLDGQWDKAALWYSRALNISPDYQLALKNLALLKSRQKQYDEAIVLLEKFMEPWEARNDIAYLAMLANDLEAAEVMFVDAIELSPSFYSEAWENLERVRQRI